MRAVIYGAALVALASGAALAAPSCPDPADQSAFDIVGLQTELQLLTETCKGDDEHYNDFVNKFHPDLIAAQHRVDDWFKHQYGARGQKQHDNYVTLLANGQSTEAQKMGTDFCPRTEPMFHEVMSLPDGNDLAPYAAGKDTFPPIAPACPAPEAASTHGGTPAAHHHARHRR